MKLLLLSLVACASLSAQVLTFSVQNGTTSTPLPSTYQFADTPQGSSTPITVKVTNSSTYTMLLAQVYVTMAANSAVVNPNFTITGLNQSGTLAPGSSSTFTLTFAPASIGPVTGYLQAAYALQQNGCSLSSSSSSTQCTSTITNYATLQGNATSPQILLTYNPGSGDTLLQPNSSSPLSFGNVSTSATASITFKISNQTSAALPTPTVSLSSQVYASSAFQLDTSSLAGTVPANGSATFRVVFAPGQTGLASATILVGSNSYPIQGFGIVLADIDALQISYVDATGVRSLPQAATPINFGQVVPGTAASTLSFTVTNPTISFNAVSISTLAVTGNGFTVANAPSLPAVIQPGGSITFQLSFVAPRSGTYTGTISIGTRQFSLSALGVTSPVPTPSFQLSEVPLTNQQQVNLTVALASAAQVAAVGTLTMQFSPSITSVTDDPAVLFVGTSGRQLQLNVAAGAQNATYNNQSALAFQTGTTAGTVTFTLTLPSALPYTQAFTITPAQPHIATIQAVRQAPNLVVTITGYDNTYSASQLNFTFYDTTGKVVTPNGIPVNVASAFRNYFFTNNQTGGAFSLQASFPVTGDVTQVGSVSLTLTNSAGQATATQTFQ